jgi:hypothetical protein
MNRRSFLQRSALGASAWLLPPSPRETQHVIFIVNGGGVRKKDYYEDATLSPNIKSLASDGFVFEEDHCERVASHDAAFAELLQGREWIAGGPQYPTILDYIGNGMYTRSIRAIPNLMCSYKPRILVCRETAHDVGHLGYEKYLQVVKATDDAVGEVFDWIGRDREFRNRTSIVIRPEFGRDDEVNRDGDLHHSYGFYYTHRVASIFWGPAFNRGLDRDTVIRTVDMAPTLAKVFGVGATYTQGRVLQGLLRIDSAH